jgi:deoxyribonuclease V
MLACVDVAYGEDEAVAACVLFHDWADPVAAEEHVQRVRPVEPYQPGQFYRRELPCLLAVLAPLRHRLRAVVIDGYVWLGEESSPGLGAHLHEALGVSIPVIGVAKTRYAGADTARTVYRGTSRRPLYVTAAGLDPAAAARHIARMQGPFRIPTLLKRADHLSRRVPET